MNIRRYQQKENNKNLALITGVLSVFLLGEAHFVVNPVLSALSGKYPDIPYAYITYLATIPNLVAVPMGILSGYLIKKGMKYRTQVLSAALLIIISGVIPYWISDFTGWIICRVFFGIGFGICVPMSGTLAQRCFTGETAAKVQGWGATAQNLGGVALQMLSGFVAVWNVEYVWLVHLVLLVPLILIAFTMSEPKEEEDTVMVQPVFEEQKGLPLIVYVKSVGFGLMFMFMYPFMTSISMILEKEGIGSSTLAGTINSSYTIGGMIAGVIFIYVFHGLKKWCMPLMYLLIGGALLGAFLAKTPVALIILGMLIGTVTFILWSAHVTEFGQIVSSKNMAIASGIFVGATNLFCFFSSPLVGLIGRFVSEDSRMPLLMGSIGCIIIGIVYVICTLRESFIIEK